MIPASLLMEQKPIKETCCICGRQKTIAANFHYDLEVFLGVQPLSAQILIWSCSSSLPDLIAALNRGINDNWVQASASTYTMIHTLRSPPKCLQIQPPTDPTDPHSVWYICREIHPSHASSVTKYAVPKAWRLVAGWRQCGNAPYDMSLRWLIGVLTILVACYNPMYIWCSI